MSKQPRSAALFATNVRKLRESHGYYLRQIAEFVGVTVPTVHRWECQGDKFCFPNAKHIDSLADIYQIAIADFFDPAGAEKKNMHIKANVGDALAILNSFVKTQTAQKGKAG